MIQDGSTVSIHYTLTIDGNVVDSSVDRDPLTFVQGSGQIIPGLEDALNGRTEGDQVKVEIPPEKGYGPRNPEALRTIPRQALDHLQGLKEGDMVRGQVQDQQFEAMVASMDEQNVTLDLNHPLAGKTLQFEVEVVSIGG